MADERVAPAGINPHVAHPARVYDYWLGGTENFAADRELAEKLMAVMPELPRSVRDNRAFLGRVVRIVAEAGIRQFLDLGSGLPTVENTHEIAQRVASDARVAYVDNDPLVPVHARALLSGAGRDTSSINVIEADVREPDAILSHPELRDLIDFGEPVAVLLLGVLHFLADDVSYGVVARLREAMAPGSYLIVSHLTGDSDPQRMDEWLDVVKRSPSRETSYPRTRDQVQRFFHRFDLLDPGVVPVDQWRPADSHPMEHFLLYGGVGQVRR